MTLLVQGALLVPMDGGRKTPIGDVRTGDLLFDDGRIAAIGRFDAPADVPRFDGRGLVAFPGFVQGHVHYCQTLFRGLADDLPLMRWLRERIWPLEAAHDEDSIAVSAELSVLELLRGGTTTVQVMESVQHTAASFEVARASGMTTILGNCLMDTASDGVPSALVQDTRAAMQECERLRTTFHELDRLHYAISPRFVLSCSEALCRDAAAFANENGLRIHTHACEHPDEIAAVRQALRKDNLVALADLGLLSPRTSLAHCVHTTEPERALLVETGSAVQHCPTANLKLGSGIAPVAEYRRRGLRVGLGADGAACNNRLSALTEMRQATLVQAAREEPGVLTAGDALAMATIDGARALGLADAVGSLEPGKRADVVLADLQSPLLGGEPVTRLVHSETACIRHVFVGGEMKIEDGEPRFADPDELTSRAREQLANVLGRAGLAR